MASVQLLQVINTSFNFPIYWFVGNFRETFMVTFCSWGKKKQEERHEHGNIDSEAFKAILRESRNL